MSHTSVTNPVFVPLVGTWFVNLVGSVVTVRHEEQVPGCHLGPPVTRSSRPGRVDAGCNVGAHIT